MPVKNQILLLSTIEKGVHMILIYYWKFITMNDVIVESVVVSRVE